MCCDTILVMKTFPDNLIEKEPEIGSCVHLEEIRKWESNLCGKYRKQRNNDERTDLQLLLDYHNKNDKQALVLLMSVWSKIWASFLIKRLKMQSPDADDVISKATITLCKEKPKYNDEESFKSWMFGVVKNERKQLLRDTFFKRLKNGNVKIMTCSSQELKNLFKLDSSSIIIEEELDKNDDINANLDVEQMKLAMKYLPLKQRESLNYELSNYSLRSEASKDNKNPHTIRSNVQHAKTNLRFWWEALAEHATIKEIQQGKKVFFKISEIAEKMHISPTTLAKKYYQGRMKAIQLGKKDLYVRKEWVKDAIMKMDPPYKKRFINTIKKNILEKQKYNNSH